VATKNIACRAIQVRCWCSMRSKSVATPRGYSTS
jgi:hypothetical protein